MKQTNISQNGEKNMEDKIKFIKTFNPVMGCDIGCSYCYARKINQRFKHIPDFSIPTFMEYRLPQLYKDKPRLMLITSMSDFSSWCKNSWCDKIFKALKDNPQHQYIILTKRPEQCQFSTDLDNVWMGVTVTSKNEVQRIYDMKKNIKAKHYHITFEPLFEDVGELNLTNIDWIVIGAETGNRRGKIKPKKEWIQNIVNQARDKNIPVCMKMSLFDIVGEEFKQDMPKEFLEIIDN